MTAETSTILEAKFNPRTLDRFKTPQQKIDFIKSAGLLELGKGKGRHVFLLDSKKVLKVAMNDFGAKQNRSEEELSKKLAGTAIVTRVFDAATDHGWILSEVVREIKDVKEFESLAGVTWVGFTTAIEFAVERGLSLNHVVAFLQQETSISPKDVTAVKQSQFVAAVIAAANKAKLIASDLIRLEHWGKTADDKIVLLDYGYTDETVAAAQDAVAATPETPQDVLQRQRFDAVRQQRQSDPDFFEETAVKSTVTEGGLGGHLMYPYENPDLTFSELIEIIEKASNGDLEEVNEKLDGQNIFFSYNIQQAALKFARNKGDLTKGGMGKEEVDAKWQAVPAVQKAFSAAFTFLQQAVESLSKQQRLLLFGENASVWYSAEVISTANPNVISYDTNVIAPHHFGAVAVDASGNKSPVNKEVVEQLLAALNGFQAAADQQQWKLVAPLIVSLGKNEQAGKAAKQQLEQLVAGVGLTTSNTIRDYVSKAFEKLLLAKGVDPSAAVAIAKRALDDDDKIKNIRDVPSAKDNPAVVEADKAKAKILRAALKPLDRIIGDFAVKVLKTQQSLLAANPSQVVQSIRQRIKEAVKNLEANPSNASFVKQEMERLKSVDAITSSMEGVVFRYKGNSYKLTGAFAPINQILGAFKFGKTPSVTSEEKNSYLHGNGNNSMETKKPKETIRLSELKKQINEAVKKQLAAKKKKELDKEEKPSKNEKKHGHNESEKAQKKKKIVKVGALRNLIKEAVLKNLRESYNTGVLEDLELEGLMAELEEMDAGEPTNDGLQERWAEVVQETPPAAPGAQPGAPPAGTKVPTAPGKDPETGLDLKGVMAKMKTVSDPKEMEKWITKFQELSGNKG